MTVSEARGWLQYYSTTYGKDKLQDWIKRARNVSNADITDRGDVHVGAPQNCWLSDGALVSVVETIKSEAMAHLAENDVDA